MTNRTHDAESAEFAVIRLFGHVMAAGGLFLVLTSFLDRMPWEAPKRTLVVLSLVATTYAMAAFGLALANRRGRRSTIGVVVVASSAAALPALIAYIVLSPQLGFGLIAIGLGAVLVLVAGMFLVPGRVRLKLVAQGLLLVAGIAAQAANFQALRNTPDVVTEFIDTTLYDLKVTYFRPFPRMERFQGGLTLFDDRYLLATGDGDLYVFRRSGEQKLDLQRLAYTVPINIAEFEAAVGTQVPVRRFRVADALTQQTPAGLRLFVTHHYWNVRDACWTMRVSSLQGVNDDFLSPSAPLAWTTVYETSPCVGLAVTEADPVRFTGIENGGRMVFLDGNRLLVTFGDHEMNGWATTVMASQDPESSYGKTILIDLTTRTHEVFTLGHRNPQGLHLSEAGIIWSTEHGPRGGDELNKLVRGLNYGWPLATYGVEYGTKIWPLTAKPGEHENFEQPFISWSPSIGISAVIEVTSPRFAYWHGDLLVTSLVGQAVWRLRIRDDRVVLTEQIPVGRRIRDLTEGHDGELVMWTDDRALAFISPAEQVMSGEYLYRVCAGCHVPPAGSTDAVGPTLVGIGGREVASVHEFDYSPGLREFGGTWTRDRLDAYIRDPRSVVPGTTMIFSGLNDDGARELLLDYMLSRNSRLDVAPKAPMH